MTLTFWHVCYNDRATYILEKYTFNIIYHYYTEDPGRLQPMGSQRVGHDWTIKHNITNMFRNHNHIFQFLFIFLDSKKFLLKLKCKLSHRYNGENFKKNCNKKEK